MVRSDNVQILAYHQEIFNAIANPRLGETYRHVLCPQCHSSEKGSFTVTVMPEVMVYCCHRASCGLKGAIGQTSYSRDTSYTSDISEKSFAEGSGIKAELESLSTTQSEYIRTKYQINPEDMGAAYHRRTDRIAYPIYGHYTRGGHPLRGFSLRCYDDRKPKTFTYPLVNAPMIGYFGKPTELSPCVIVEDLVSAYKINVHTGLPSCSLNGTGVSLKRAFDIAQVYSSVVFYLDQNARGKAAKAILEYGSLFGSCSMVSTETDPKDTPVEKLKQILGGFVGGVREYNTKLRRDES